MWIVIAVALTVTAVAGFLVINRLPIYFSNKSVPARELAIVTRLETEGAIDFSAENLDAQVFNFSNLAKDKIVILNFWATWCEPCVEEFASMIKLAKMFSDDLIIVAISQDENKSDVISFSKVMGDAKNLVILLDPKGEVRAQYAIDKLPESFIFGKNFKLVKKIVGTRDWFSEDSQYYFHHLISEKK